LPVHIGDENEEGYQNCFLKKWDEFVNSSNTPSSVRTATLQAWKRCRKLGIDPENPKFVFLSEEDLKQKQKSNRDLIAAAEQYLALFSASLTGIPHIVALSDKDGWIIAARGATGVFGNRAARLDLGANWSEKNIGNNGIGTALVEQKPVIIYGVEHYSQAYHSYTCFGIPIFSNGNLIGAFDVSVPNKNANPGHLAVAMVCVKSIESTLELTEMKLRLDRSEKMMAVGSLLATTVHDLRNSISVIRGISQLGQLTARDKKEQQYFQNIVSQVDKLSSLVDELLGTSKLGNPVQVSLAQVMDEIIKSELETLCKIQGIDVEYSSNCPLETSLHINMFKRTIHNIVKNAIQAMAGQGKLTITIDYNDDKALVTISDTGPGIPSQIRDSVFEPFVSDNTNGTGLGLYMAHHVITKLHQGRIWFESLPDQGTTFFIELPGY